MDLKGKVAIVTGASRGIGRHLAKALVRRGVLVAIAARSVERKGRLPGTIGETLAEIEEAGGKALAVQADVSAPEDLERLVAATVERFGRLDILINNAADTRIISEPIESYPRHRWLAYFDTNVHGPFALMALAVPHLRASGGGVIINFTSGEGAMRPYSPEAAPPAGHRIGALLGYAASKAALNRLSNALAPELAADNIAIVCINPGLTRTELIDVLIDNGAMDANAGHSMDVPVELALEVLGAADPRLYSGMVLNAAAGRSAASQL